MHPGIFLHPVTIGSFNALLKGYLIQKLIDTRTYCQGLSHEIIPFNKNT